MKIIISFSSNSNFIFRNTIKQFKFIFKFECNIYLVDLYILYKIVKYVMYLHIIRII